MRSEKDYIRAFFQTLTLDADRQGHTYGALLSASVDAFLADQSKAKAYDVYSMFFDIYRTAHSGTRSFVDLLDLLRGYEEHSGRLSDGQRDHYVHSVNVFLLGLCLYANNAAIRAACRENRDRQAVPRAFSTEEEEFLFSWGLAALFHDIGYPLEIIHSQTNKFISFVSGNRQKEILPYTAYRDFGRLNVIEAEPADTPVAAPFDPLCPTDLIAWRISEDLGVDAGAIKDTMDRYLSNMQAHGFVDHGYYSALIVLKWYGEALLSHGAGALFYNQILRAAAAIFLHNAYRNVLVKPPYRRPPLRCADAPLAWLLILCDEAQEWNREAYGEKVRARLAVDDSALSIDDRALQLHYITRQGILETDFLEDKRQLLRTLLDIGAVFPDGISVTATMETGQLIETIRRSAVLPRLLVENIEALAKAIHADYNAKQLARHPGTPLTYPDWASLPDTLKYSNVRQAQSIVEKLRLIGCRVDVASGEPEYMLTGGDVERLARAEHELWVEERLKNGWRYGPEKNVDGRISPYLVPYDLLTEEIKELDRDTIRNIRPLLASVGLAVYRDAED
ncbi:MAG: hypothetical protein IKD96_08035 [Oscillospiraceae bacterium]|nr:hypothetical protein [Oscillospiraceae bacterium]